MGIVKIPLRYEILWKFLEYIRFSEELFFMMENKENSEKVIREFKNYKYF